MIVDRIQNSSIYCNLGEKIEKALNFLKNEDLASLELGKHVIDGTDVYAMVNECSLKKVEEGKWEAHKKYIDIQYVLEGSEVMGYAHLDDMKISKEYDEEKDFLLLEGEGSFVTIHSGQFAIFMPQDAHMPCIASDNCSKSKKIIVKVAV